MSRTHVALLLVILVLLAGLAALGPDRVGELVLRVLGQKEAANRAALEPDVRVALDGLRSDLAREGIETYIGSTLRTPAEQAAKEVQGSSTTATNSWHLVGRAVDLIPIDPATGQPDREGTKLELFKRMHAFAPGWGFRGLAFHPDGTVRYLKRKDGSKFWDGGHLEHPGPYRTVAEAQVARAARGVA